MRDSQRAENEQSGRRKRGKREKPAGRLSILGRTSRSTEKTKKKREMAWLAFCMVTILWGLVGGLAPYMIPSGPQKVFFIQFYFFENLHLKPLFIKIIKNKQFK